MRKTILLAVDDEPHVSAATELTRELSRDTGDRVIVLHVHEFAVGRFGRLQVDCAEGDGERLVSEVVADLRASGVAAEPEVRETGVGHIAKAILASADAHVARVIVLGSSGRTDVPHLPFGSVSLRLLHMARRPVLIVPRPVEPAEEMAHSGAQAAGA
ncbi:MAG: universal stress protein [Streptosporangiaceae bacterium]